MELGFGEIVVILFIVVLLFGPKKLPQLGDALGRGIRSVEDAVSGRDEPTKPETPPSDPAPQLPAASATAPVEREAEKPATPAAVASDSPPAR